MKMLKKLCVVMAFAISMSTNTFAASNNWVTKTPTLKDKMALEDVYLKIEPKDEVETGSTIYINFTNAEVFSQAVIDGKGNEKEYGYKLGGYQYRNNYKKWNNESFASFMPNVKTNELPYKITRMSKTQIEVRLINVPARYAGNSLVDINGVDNEPVYVIPMVVRTDGVGTLKATIDSNGTAISGGSSSSISSVVNANSFISTTETTTELTTEAVTEATTEAVTSDSYNKSVKVQIGSTKVEVDGTVYDEGVAPYVQQKSNSTMVPLRVVAVALGGNMSSVDNSDIIKWDAETKTVTINYNNRLILFEAGSSTITVDGKRTDIEYGATAEIVEGRMYVPFRALGTALGVSVDWEPETKTAIFVAS